MASHEYRVVPAPRRGIKARGARRAEDRFARAVEAEMNRMAAEGWEFVRSDTLPCERRAGWFSRPVTVFETLLVFRREAQSQRQPAALMPPPVALTPPAFVAAPPVGAPPESVGQARPLGAARPDEPPPVPAPAASRFTPPPAPPRPANDAAPAASAPGPSLTVVEPGEAADDPANPRHAAE